MMLAAMAGHRDCIEVLINAGAKVNKPKEGGGWTAVILASQYHHPKCAELLVEKGANLNMSAGGKTARGWLRVSFHPGL